MAEEFTLKFVDEHAEGLDLALRAFGQGADRVSSVKDFVDQVLAQIGTDGCIKTLTLVGHGSPGSIGVGSGKRVARTGDQSLDLHNVERWEKQLRRLHCRFCKPDGQFNLLGCNTGAGLEGARLLRLIVNFIRCCKAVAPVEPVTPLSESRVNQIVEAIGEGADEHAKLPEPIPAEHLKTVSMRPDLGHQTLAGGPRPAALTFYDPSAIVGARFMDDNSRAARARAEHIEGRLLSAIRNSLKRAEVALAPVALFAVDGYLQLQVRVSSKRVVWLPAGALVGARTFYSSFADDTTFIYMLSSDARKGLARLGRKASRRNDA